MQCLAIYTEWDRWHPDNNASISVCIFYSSEGSLSEKMYFSFDARLMGGKPFLKTNLLLVTDVSKQNISFKNKNIQQHHWYTSRYT